MGFRADMLLQIVEALVRYERALGRSRCVSAIAATMAFVMGVLFALDGFPLSSAAFAFGFFITVQNWRFERGENGKLRSELQKAGLRLARVTLGRSIRESIARLEFADGDVLLLASINAGRRKAIRSLAFFLDAEFAYLGVPRSWPQRFVASVNRGNHELRGMLRVMTHDTGCLVDLLERFPDGNPQLVETVTEAARRALQWGLMGATPEKLSAPYDDVYNLEGLPFSVRILWAKLRPRPYHMGR